MTHQIWVKYHISYSVDGKECGDGTEVCVIETYVPVKKDYDKDAELERVVAWATPMVEDITKCRVGFEEVWSPPRDWIEKRINDDISVMLEIYEEIKILSNVIKPHDVGDDYTLNYILNEVDSAEKLKEFLNNMANKGITKKKTIYDDDEIHFVPPTDPIPGGGATDDEDEEDE